MNSNKTLIINGGVAVALLLGLVTFLFINFSLKLKNSAINLPKDDIIVYQGIPSDAVMVFDFDQLQNFSRLIEEEHPYSPYIFDRESPLITFQKELSSINKTQRSKTLFSLHYSGKNSVSMLQILDLSKFKDKEDVYSILNSGSESKKEYNNVPIYIYTSGLSVAIHKELLIASTSDHIVENSIRHLDNKSSIIDNDQFKQIVSECETENNIFINLRQIGKFFSGEVDREFLGYSTFFHNLSPWLTLNINGDNDKINLSGYFENNNDDRNFITTLNESPSKKSKMGEILPHNTLFAAAIQIDQESTYLDSYRNFIEVQKRSNKYRAKINSVSKNKDINPDEWLASMKIEELIVALCRVEGGYEWVNILRLDEPAPKGSNSNDTILSGRFKYKGYLGSLFGELYDNSKEEEFFRKDEWYIIGSNKIIKNYTQGNVEQYNLKEFIEQTPASDIFSTESKGQIIINLKESPDQILKPFKSYLKGIIKSSIEKSNFNLLTIDIGADNNSTNSVELNYYSTELEAQPTQKVKRGKAPINQIINHTITIPKGPFKLYDVRRKDNTYLAQNENNNLSYLDKSKKGIWTIPFKTPICGMVEQVDIYKNGKLQMLFISGDKLYALDILARYVSGFPIKLEKSVTLGPKLYDLNKNKNYLIMTLNEDNTLSLYDISGKKAKGWNDIKSPEFIRELPELISINGINYWVLKGDTQTMIYSFDGTIIEFEKGKQISKTSKIEHIDGNKVKVTSVDGREYLIDLKTREIKRG